MPIKTIQINTPSPTTTQTPTPSPRFPNKVTSADLNQSIMAKDPCKGVVCVVDDQVLKKDVLSQEEVKPTLQRYSNVTY